MAQSGEAKKHNSYVAALMAVASNPVVAGELMTEDNDEEKKRILRANGITVPTKPDYQEAHTLHPEIEHSVIGILWV